LTDSWKLGLTKALSLRLAVLKQRGVVMTRAG
jgi:hypothetical protein